MTDAFQGDDDILPVQQRAELLAVLRSSIPDSGKVGQIAAILDDEPVESQDWQPIRELIAEWRQDAQELAEATSGTWIEPGVRLACADELEALLPPVPAQEPPT